MDEFVVYGNNCEVSWNKGCNKCLFLVMFFINFISLVKLYLYWKKFLCFVISMIICVYGIFVGVSKWKWGRG